MVGAVRLPLLPSPVAFTCPASPRPSPACRPSLQPGVPGGALGGAQAGVQARLMPWTSTAPAQSAAAAALSLYLASALVPCASLACVSYEACQSWNPLATLPPPRLAQFHWPPCPAPPCIAQPFPACQLCLGQPLQPCAPLLPSPAHTFVHVQYLCPHCKCWPHV